jgi:hypothetical protein
MFHASELFKSTPHLRKREKALANRPTNGKRIKIINDKICAEKKEKHPG